VAKDNGDKTFEITWDEGEPSSVPGKFIWVLPPLIPGEQVKATWDGDGQWYDAVLQKDNGDGSFVVRYDVDQSEATLSAEKVRSLLEPPGDWFAPYSEGDAPPKVQDRVEALKKIPGAEQGNHEPGVVERDNMNGTFTVRWDHDHKEEDISREDIRTLASRYSATELRVGQRVSGVVSRLAVFGAFVDIGTTSKSHAMLHVDRMGNNVDDPADVVSMGQALNVQVHSIAEDGKVSLSLVQSQTSGSSSSTPSSSSSCSSSSGGSAESVQRPGDMFEFENVEPDKWLTGKVIDIHNFGISVNVSPPSGGEPQQGLVHKTEMKVDEVTDPGKVEIGQEIQVRVKAVSIPLGRMSLSMR